MARRIKRTIEWTKGGGTQFGHRTAARPHGGDCEFKIERYKRFYTLYDCRDATDRYGGTNHWFGQWLIGCQTKAQCRRAAEVLLTDGYEAMYREFNPAMAERYDRMDGPREWGWEHRPNKPEWDVDEAVSYLQEKQHEGCVPTVEEVAQALYNKYGLSGRTSRLINSVLTHITVRNVVEAFAC
jgi:hypothetical protein